MGSIIFIILVIGSIFLVYKYDVKKEREEEERIRINQIRIQQCRERDRAKFNEQYSQITERLGQCIDVKLVDSVEYSIDNHIMFFEISQIVIIESVEYKFVDILGYSLVDDARNETITTSVGTAKTSTGNMLGRAVVGGVLTGGLGAVAGASTAKKNVYTDATSQTTTTHDYFIYLNVNSLQHSVITIHIGKDIEKAQKLTGMFNVIIKRNEQ